MAVSVEERRWVAMTMLAYATQYCAELQGLSEERLRWKPSEREWSLNEVAAHLAEIEEIFLNERLGRIAREENPPIEAFDHEQYAIDHHYNEQDAMANLERFTRAVAANAELVLTTEWSRMGVHSIKGPVSFGAFLMTLAAHHSAHVHQIRRVKLQYLQQQGW